MTYTKTLTISDTYFQTQSISSEAGALPLSSSPDPNESTIVKIAFAWTPIIMSAATSFAGAIGTKLGERLGDEFANALFGSKDDYSRNVISRLQRIETKLDDLLSFVKSDLPQLWREDLEKAFIRDLRSKMIAKRGTIEGLLNLLSSESDPETKYFDELRSELNQYLEYVDALLQYGPPGYLAQLGALGLAISSANILLPKIPSFAYELASRANNFLTYLERITSPDEFNSFEFNKRYYQDWLARSDFTAGKMRDNCSRPFLLCVSGPFSPPDEDNELFDQYWGRRAIIGLQGNRAWGGGIGYVQYIKVKKGEIPKDEDFGLDVLPFRAVPRGPDADSFRGWYFDAVMNAVIEADRNCAHFPNLISKITNEIATIDGLKETCRRLKALAANGLEIEGFPNPEI